MADLTTPTHTAHGGDVDAVSREFGIPVGQLVDFSASINPLGPPRAVTARLARDAADSSLLSRYPDPMYSDLRAALVRRLDVPAECLTIGNGSAALIGAAIRATQPRVSLLVTPAFSEQSSALCAASCAIERFPLDEQAGFRLDPDALCHAIATIRPDLCLLTNPHNPSGTLTDRTTMLRIAQAAADSGVQLVIDEAFIDFASRESLTPMAPGSDHVVILRSLTKFFGMPALRVGYAVSTPPTAARIQSQIPAWPVTALAATAAAEALDDEDYARTTRTEIAKERTRLRDLFAGIGIEAYESVANFLLFKLPPGELDSTRLRALLIRQHGLVIRDCRSFEGMADGRFVRVAVRNHSDNERLVSAIGAVIKALKALPCA